MSFSYKLAFIFIKLWNLLHYIPTYIQCQRTMHLILHILYYILLFTVAVTKRQIANNPMGSSALRLTTDSRAYQAFQRVNFTKKKRTHSSKQFKLQFIFF